MEEEILRRKYMNIEKPDEMERFQNGKAALFTFAFYGFSLVSLVIVRLFH